MRTHFESFGLVEGKDILLGNSPNRVMPGRLVDRVTQSDKLVAGLHPETPRMITEIYSHIVMDGNLYATNSLTAEVVKTLENAYRDVRIAYSTEVVRYCDQQDINFYSLRDKVNQKLSQTDTASNNPNAVPSGGILIPMLGVGGHCLPKDGILLWWRKAEKGLDTSHSLILESRKINNESPKETIRLAERKFGSLKGKAATVMGVAYRFNSEDTRNSPSIALALELEKKGCKVCLHDPFVKPDDQNLLKFNVANSFTNNLEEALSNSEFLFFGTAHKAYLDALQDIFNQADQCKGIIDACNLFNRTELELLGWAYTGIGRGRQEPSEALVNYVYKGFRAMERGVANEVKALTEFLNDNYVNEAFNRVDFQEVRRLAASCSTGCLIPDAGLVEVLTDFQGFSSRLVGFASQPYSLA